MNELNITVVLKGALSDDEGKKFKDKIKQHFKTESVLLMCGFDKDEIIIINEKTLQISRSNDISI